MDIESPRSFVRNTAPNPLPPGASLPPQGIPAVPERVSSHDDGDIDDKEMDDLV
ncbi:hypothetical protein ACHAPA_007971 [Fusarium lateritium]